MAQKEQINQHIYGRQAKLVPKLIINWLFPLLLYLLLRTFFSNDTMPLAIAGIIPAIWTIILYLWRRQINWIGVITIFGLFIAIVVSALSGGSSLPLKLYHPLIAGITGLILLISVVIKRPLLILLLKKFRVGDPERFNNPSINRKVTLVTGMFGSLLLADALIHTIMALTLTTGTYLFMSRIVMLVFLAVLYFSSKWVMRRM